MAFSSLASSPGTPLISLAVSAASLGMTTYFWIVKSLRERPRLSLDVVGQQSFVDLGRGSDEDRWLQFRMAIVVANRSTLPNAVLDARVYWLPRDESTWEETPDVALVDSTKLPVNIPSLQTGLVTLEWWQKFPTSPHAESLSAPVGIINGYLEEYFAGKNCIAVEVFGLQGKSFRQPLPIRGSRQSASLRRAA
jgi:hypothetical protein